MNSYTKRGGAARRRFCVICKKPEGGGRKSTPPGCARVNKRQFGLRKGMSTYMPLMLLQEKITSAFEFNKIVCGLYLDLRKAFDAVDIDILLSKIQCYRTNHNAYNILKSYLSGRMQCVQIDTVVSSFLLVETHVQHGSILGPLLFLIYINDFPLVYNQMTTYLYADDTSIFIEGSDEREIKNTSFNKIKIAALSLNLVGVSIKRVISVKYLGVFIDEDLKWHTYLSKLYTVLCRNVGIINRARYFLHSSHLLLLTGVH